METALSIAYLVIFWIALLGMLTAVAKILFSVRYGPLREARVFVKQNIEGVQLPENERTSDFMSVVYNLAVASGFMLLSITIMGFIILLGFPNEMMIFGIASALLSQVLIIISNKKLKKLSS